MTKVLENNPGNLSAKSLKGWIYLNAPKEELQQKGLQFLEEALNEE